MIRSFVFLALALLFNVDRAHAYPEFIAYGYKTCLTCHYLGTGGGGLTDYGRAVFASEIAAKPLHIDSISDEKLAEYSHFLGGIQSPHWFKPGIKYRRLVVKHNPGSGDENRRPDSWLTMQADLNIASFTNEDSTLGLITTLSYVESSRFAEPNVPIGSSEVMTREYFVRWLQSENSIWYVGFFDKAFGIKHPDHKAVNRDPINLGINDQVHGVMYQWQHEAHDLYVQPFLGNLSLPGDKQKRGISVLYEYQAGEKTVLGASARTEKDEAEQLTTAGVHTRIGTLGYHSLMDEFGYKKTYTQTPLDEASGFYNYLELQLRMIRGLFFQSIVQLDRPDMEEETYNYAWGFGLLYFPMQRIELRTQAIQTRTYSTKSSAEDQWTVQGQLHLSL